MKELRNSVLLLLSYLIAILGISLIQFVEYNFVDFEQVFFVLFALAAVAGILIVPRIRPSIYIFLMFWAVIYGLIWITYWRGEILTTQLHVLQLILIEISAGLSYVAGSHIDEVENIIGSLSASAYPNRALDIKEAGERINVEITRSRRFNRPLTVMVVHLRQLREKEPSRKIESLHHDLLTRFAAAKAGQIISELVRQTDLIVRDKNGEFVIVCPETEAENLTPLAERICKAIQDEMGGSVIWSSASFPDETLSFDELLKKAKQRLVSSEENHVLDGEKSVHTLKTKNIKKSIIDGN